MSDSNIVEVFVLETDEPHPDTQDRKGSYSDIFHTLFTRAGNEHDPPLKVRTSDHYVVDDPEHDHHGHVPAISDIPEYIEAVLISGSMYDAHGDDKWITQLLDLLREIWVQRPHVRLSGVCFGHQLLSRLLGSKVERHPEGEWELSHTDMKLSPIGQQLFRTTDETLGLHQMHQDRVLFAPSSSTTDLITKDMKVHVWASTEHTKIQGLYIRDRLFTTQGHLAFDEKMVHREIEMREESGGIDKDDYPDEARERAHLEHDGLVVAIAILRFFNGEDTSID